MGRMIRQRPELLASWALKTGASGAGHALMDSYNLRPSYSVFQIYKRFGNHLLAANADNPMVSLFAAKRDDGTLTAIFVNRGDAAVTMVLQLEQGGAYKLEETYLFDATHNAEPADLPAFENGDPVELAPLSVTLWVFAAK